ncbi:MAG: general secretion pathway protein GspD, partial [Betaproteobacteria bacterium]|nr:general secretion pathway protein GspD [Betaproteobacteria bacterium]
MKRIRAFARTTLLIATVIVSACAQNPVFHEGLQLLSEDRIEEGLARLEQASKEAPANTEYRSALFKQRALALAQLLTQAETARVNNDPGQAQAAYRRVLNIDPANERAKAGLEAVNSGRRHRALVEEAEALLKKNDRSGAERKIRAVLAENPGQREARAVQRRIDEASRKETLAAKTLKPNLKRPITLEFRDASLQAI